MSAIASDASDHKPALSLIALLVSGSLLGTLALMLAHRRRIAVRS